MCDCSSRHNTWEEFLMPYVTNAWGVQILFSTTVYSIRYPISATTPEKNMTRTHFNLNLKTSNLIEILTLLSAFISGLHPLWLIPLHKRKDFSWSICMYSTWSAQSVFKPLTFIQKKKDKWAELLVSKDKESQCGSTCICILWFDQQEPANFVAKS